MPTYEYKCNDCGITFELFQKMSDAPIKVCPECGGEVKRLIGAGLRPIFKGSGFYETDYKSNNKSSDKKKASSSSATENKTTNKKSTTSSGSKGTTKEKK